jgi:hypothetical protein
MATNPKLAFQVRKLATALGVNDTEDATVESLLKQLCINYKEYELQPAPRLKMDVKEVLLAVVAEKKARQLNSGLFGNTNNSNSSNNISGQVGTISSSSSGLNSAVVSKFSRSSSMNRLANVELLNNHGPTNGSSEPEGANSVAGDSEAEPSSTPHGGPDSVGPSTGSTIPASASASVRKKRKQATADPGDVSRTGGDPKVSKFSCYSARGFTSLDFRRERRR